MGMRSSIGRTELADLPRRQHERVGDGRRQAQHERDVNPRPDMPGHQYMGRIGDRFGDRSDLVGVKITKAVIRHHLEEIAPAAIPHHAAGGPLRAHLTYRPPRIDIRPNA